MYVQILQGNDRGLVSIKAGVCICIPLGIPHLGRVYKQPDTGPLMSGEYSIFDLHIRQSLFKFDEQFKFIGKGNR